MTARVTRSIEHRINFGDYEGLTIRASAESDCDEGLEALNFRKLKRVLAESIEEELIQARRLAPDRSYIPGMGREVIVPRQLARRRAPVGPVDDGDAYEDEQEELPPRRSRHIDDEPRETTRRRRSRDDDDTDPPRKRRSRDEEEDRPRKAKASHAKGGWATVETNRAARYSNPGRLQVKDKEVVVKFLEPEPFASYGQHWVGQRSYTCGLNLDFEKCPLCGIGNACRYLALFNVVDMDSAENRYWEVGPEATKTLMEFHEEDRTSPLSKDGLYFAAKRFKKDNGFFGFKISSIKERDLDDEFGLDPLDDDELAAAEAKLFDSSVIPTCTLSDLKAAAKEEEDD